MDHAGDIAHHVIAALKKAGFPVRINLDANTREHREYSIQTRDSGAWYRLEIREVVPTEDELYWPEVNGTRPGDTLR